MGARSYFFITLVALFTGLTLIPTTQAENEVEITSILHNDARIENGIDIEITNEAEQEVPYSLLIDVFSEDLQDSIELDSPNLIFSIDSLQTYQTSFTFTIPRSGNYIFNLTLLSNDGEITTSYAEYQYVFYENTNIQLDSIIQDYYLDIEGANWRYNDENEQIELLNLEEEHEAGVVLGPFTTHGREDNLFEMEIAFEMTESSNLTVAYTTDFDSAQLYSTEWNELYSLSSADNDKIEIGLIKDADIYIRLLSTGTETSETDYWFITGINHRFITIKHELEISTEVNYFYTTDQNPEALIEIENTGIFDQQLGNISIILDLYSPEEYIDSYSRSPNLLSGDSQILDFRLTGIDSPGNYYCIIKITLINQDIYSETFNSFVSVSLENLGSFNLNFANPETVISIDSNYEQVNLLVESSNIEGLIFNSPFTKTNLFGNYYSVALNENSGNLVISAESPGSYGTIIAAISMDQYRFSVQSLEVSTETIEGIVAPSLVFDETRTYNVNVVISNEGFYTEEYSLSYIFAAAFIDSITGPETITIKSGESTTIDVDVVPLPKIPREGGSQLNIEVKNRDESKILTYVLSYEMVNVEVLEHSCNRHSVLLGQEISCTTVITNNGYVSNSLNVDIGIKSDITGSIIIEEFEINKLEHMESWSVRTSYDPEIEGEYQMFITISDDLGIATSYQIAEAVNVVRPGGEAEESARTFNIPKINFGHGLAALSFLGISYQFKRSENLKYLTFKFFIPLYSRLQKDTLTDEPTRQNLLSHIYSKPGANFTELKERFNLHNGTLAHHINILENHEMIMSQRSGRQRLFFPFGSMNKASIRTLLVTNQTQKKIIGIVKDNPGITQSMISQRLSVSRQKVNYHVNSLVSNSILNIEKEGRITRLYPTHFT